MSPFACFPNLVIFSSLELQRCLAIVVENSNRGKFRSTPSIENPNIVSYFAEVQYDHALYFQIFKCLLLVLGSLLLSTSVLATNVGGNIPTSTWTAAGNPVALGDGSFAAPTTTGAPRASSVISQAWIRRYAAYGMLYKLVVDVGGNVLVGGHNGYGPDILKYLKDGSLVWALDLGVPDEGGIGINDIAVNSKGNLFAVGTVPVWSGWTVDYFAIMFDSTFEEQWRDTLSGPGEWNDMPIRVIPNQTGGAYVLGYSKGWNLPDTYGIINYDSVGSVLWQESYPYPWPGDCGQCFYNYPQDMLLDPQHEELLATGRVYYGRFDVGTVKFDKDGDPIWFRQFGDPMSDEEGFSISASPDGAYIVAGSNGAGILVKYDTSGTVVWDSEHYEPSGFETVEVDSSGIYVAGVRVDQNNGKDILIAKYDNDGNWLWEHVLNGTKNSDDQLAALELDEQGNVFMLGRLQMLGTNMDIVLKKYNTDGLELAQATFIGPDSTSDIATCMALAGDGSIYIGGFSERGVSQCDFFVMKYIQYVCGDADASGIVTISDAVYLINYIFAGGPAPSPVLSGDADCNAIVTISDAVYLINYIFAGGPAPDCC